MKLKSDLFQPGQLLFTPGVLELVEHGLDPIPYLARHLLGDWGDLGPKDKKENDLSVKAGYRIFSAYKTPAGKIWIITEADRTATTILLPEEY